MQGISAIAWWGAILSTVVFLWDIYKWFHKGPRVRASVHSDVSYPDARVINKQQLEGGVRKELALYCHIEIINLGEQTTTILSLEGAHDRQKTQPQASVSGSVFIPHDGKILPHVLRSGEMWSGRLEMSNLLFLRARGRPYIAVRFSHKSRPVRIYPGLNGRSRFSEMLHKLFRRGVPL